MKAAIRSILKGVEKVTVICSDILMYEIRNGYSIRGLQRWMIDKCVLKIFNFIFFRRQSSEY